MFKYKNFFKNKLLKLSPFSVFILIIISIFVVTLIKHQKISLQRQTIRVEIVGKDWTNNFNQYNGYRPPHWLVEDLKVGAQELSPDGRVVAKIIDIDYFERNSGNAQVFLTIKLETVDDFGSGKTVYKGKNIEIGEKIEFHFNNTSVIGQITDINYSVENLETEELLITGIYRNIPSYVANKINSGMQIINPYTGKVYARIESKKISASSENIIYDHSYSSGYVSSFRLRRDYSLKNVEVNIKLLAEKHLGRYYFSGHQVIRVGEGVTFLFPNVQLGVLEITNVAKFSELNQVQ